MTTTGTSEQVGARRSRRTGRAKALAILIAALAPLAALTACTAAASPSVGASVDAASTPSSVASVATSCPDGLVAAQEQAHGPSTTPELSVIEDALAVHLPAGTGCVLTVDGDTENSTAFYVYWPHKDAAFANSLGRAMLKSGYRPASSSQEYSTGSADARVDVFPAGDDNWSEYFGGSGVVLLAGQFDGRPGVTAAPAPRSSTGAVLTWRSACMVTLDEVDAAWQKEGIEFTGPAPAGDDSTACEYTQAKPAADVPASVDIDFRPYGPTGSYGWASTGTSWSAPSAAEGARNACSAAKRSTGNYGAICRRIDGVPVVIGAGRLDALVFPPGDYFYNVDLLNISGTDSLTEPLSRMTELLAARRPGDR